MVTTVYFFIDHNDMFYSAHARTVLYLHQLCIKTVCTVRYPVRTPHFTIWHTYLTSIAPVTVFEREMNHLIQNLMMTWFQRFLFFLCSSWTFRVSRFQSVTVVDIFWFFDLLTSERTMLTMTTASCSTYLYCSFTKQHSTVQFCTWKLTTLPVLYQSNISKTQCVIK